MIQTNNLTTKEEDMKAEQELAKFLDKYLYNRLKSKCKEIKRITEKTQQMEGIDVMIKYDDDIYVKIDEKAQLHYLDVCLPTFAFEINFIGRDNKLHAGWLYNHDLKTDTYMLIWPEETCYHKEIKSMINTTEQTNKIKEILRKIKYDDFNRVDCYLIKREKIKEYLEQNGWSEAKILEKANELRISRKYKKTPIEGTRLYYFYFSEPFNYREAPINIVIRKEELAKLAHKRYKITKERIESF